MRKQGKITVWQDDRGYGFITPKRGGAPLFVHIRAFGGSRPRPIVGQIVTYEPGNDQRGRPCASQVAFVGEPQRFGHRSSTGPNRLPLAIAAGFIVFVALAVWHDKLPATLLAAYLASSLLAFIAYAADKSAARRNRWRTPERTLHLLALCGGWPGALIAQNRLRHKSGKTAFLVIFWLCVAANCAALAYLM